MLHLQTVGDMLSCFAATGHNTLIYKIMAYLSVKDGKSETLMYISQRV